MENTDNEYDDIAKEIQRDVRLLETHSKFTGDIRLQIINKLTVAVDGMKLDPDTEKGAVLEAKMGMINSLLKAVSDSDDQKINLIKVKQRINADDTTKSNAAIISNTIAEFLKRIDNSGGMAFKSSRISGDVSPDSLLENAVREAGIEVLPGELKFQTESAADLAKTDAVA